MSAETAPSDDRGAAALELLAALYPAPLVAVAGGAGGSSARAAWTAIPSAESPRLLVPVTRPSAATRMMRRQLTGRRLRTRVARTGLSVAMSTGALMLLPRTRITVTGPADAASIEEPLRRVLGIDDLCLTMPVGPARSNRKPVLQVADRAGRVRAFAKVGHNALTANLVRREGEALRRLEAEPLRDVRVPRALACLSWEGREVLVLEPLDIPLRRLAGQDGERRLLDVVRAISDVGGRRVVDWGRTPTGPRCLSGWRGSAGRRKGFAARSSTSTPRCRSPRVPGTETSTPGTSRSSPGRARCGTGSASRRASRWDSTSCTTSCTDRSPPGASLRGWPPSDWSRSPLPRSRRWAWSRRQPTWWPAPTWSPGLPLPGRRPGGRRGRPGEGARLADTRTRGGAGMSGPVVVAVLSHRDPSLLQSPRRPDPRRRQHGGPGPPRPARRAARPGAE